MVLAHGSARLSRDIDPLAIVHEQRADSEAAADYYEKYIEISVDAEQSSLARRAIYDWGELQVIEPRQVPLAQTAKPD
ncbi:MAG: hypothetical protein F4Y47_19985 [Acidobacteriia bacterium]|nr:hypothetical protein [Terriglobia bacterium]MYG02571.1 hypothetical protein [Terriglobia bacterium]MYK08017.1 hypothetical protein [Terriglobia bacterium]